MPVMPLVRVSNADRAIDLAKAVEQGMCHTAAIHSKNLDILSRMARRMNVSIFVKNGPSLAGLGFWRRRVYLVLHCQSTGEGLTSVLDFTRVRRCTWWTLSVLYDRRQTSSARTWTTSGPKRGGR